jgi:hypothetical protein
VGVPALEADDSYLRAVRLRQEFCSRSQLRQVLAGPAAAAAQSWNWVSARQKNYCQPGNWI